MQPERNREAKIKIETRYFMTALPRKEYPLSVSMIKSQKPVQVKVYSKLPRQVARESVGSGRLREATEDAIHFRLHCLGLYRPGVIVPDEMQYSMD